jgi:predicted metal-dependent hydrolase
VGKALLPTPCLLAGEAFFDRMSREHYLEGISLFNSAKFFEAHEVLEDVWRLAPEPERKFLQGLIQVAVALHHHSRGNAVGCRSLLERARRNLARYPDDHGGLDLAILLRAVDRWRVALDQGHEVPALPRLYLHE